jgi:hypothetical protein
MFGSIVWRRGHADDARAYRFPRYLMLRGRTWSGRRGSNPRPRPWQGRALPLSYTRVRNVGSDAMPARQRQTYAKCSSRMQQPGDSREPQKFTENQAKAAEPAPNHESTAARRCWRPTRARLRRARHAAIRATWRTSSARSLSARRAVPACSRNAPTIRRRRGCHR